MMRQINLFNPALLPKKHLFSASTMLQSLALIALGLVGVVWYGRIQLAQLQKQADANAKQLATLQAQIKKINTELAPKQKSPTLEGDIRKAERHWQDLQELQTWMQATTLGNLQGYAKPMAALARQRVDGLWLTGFDFGDAGQDISLHGRTIQPELIPVYVQKLASEASFHGRAFDGLEIKQVVLTEQERNKKALQAAKAEEAERLAEREALSAAAKDNGKGPKVVRVAKAPVVEEKPKFVEFSLHGAQALVRSLPAATPSATASAASSSGVKQ